MSGREWSRQATGEAEMIDGTVVHSKKVFAPQKMFIAVNFF